MSVFCLTLDGVGEKKDVLSGGVVLLEGCLRSEGEEGAEVRCCLKDALQFCEVKVKEMGDLIRTRPQSESKAYSYHSE